MSAGMHRAKTPLLVQLGLIARRTLRAEPLRLDGDIDTATTDADAWVAPLRTGGTGARRKLTAEFSRRGWLPRPRKPKSLRRRQQKVAVAEATEEMGLAA